MCCSFGGIAIAIEHHAADRQDMLDLADSTQLMRLLAEPTRLRLLLLLQTESLTVAEMTTVTRLAQSRVSSHLARLREAELVHDEARGNTNLYSVDPIRWPNGVRRFWRFLTESIDDSQLGRDREAAREIVGRRGRAGGWAASVAGRMERQYSPGRTWEALARSFAERLRLGQTLDIASGDGVLAELVAHRAAHISCVDSSQAVIEAARKRLADHANVEFRVADMHALPFDDATFDDVFILHALPYSNRPNIAVGEAARVLNPGGQITLATIARHDNHATVAAYDHVNTGFDPADVDALLSEAGLVTETAEIRAQEARPPYFRLVTASARKQAA